MKINRRNIVMTIPLLIVNSIAITGQYIFWKSHLPSFSPAAALGFALALESIAVYIAYHAHLAELSQDSSFRLRFGSYAAGLVIGILNGSHFTADGKITAASAGMFILSAASPVLWAIHTHRESRDDLKSKGLIEDRAVKLGATRWTLWPGRTFRVYRLAAWTGQRNPVLAIADWEEMQTVNEPQDESMTIDTAQSKADAVRVAFREIGTNQTATAISAWLAERGHTVDPAYVRQLRGSFTRKEAQDRRRAIHALPETRISPNGRHEQANIQ